MKNTNPLTALAFLCAVFFFTNCKQNLKKDNNLIIPLKVKNNSGFGSYRPIKFLKNNAIPETYKEEITEDSTKIGYRGFISTKKLNSLVEKNLIDQKTLDTIKKGIYFISGIKNGEQFFSIDLNQNNTFKDDKTYTFSTDVTYKTRQNFNLDSLFPSQKIVVTKLSGNNFYRDTLFAKFYPDYNYLGYEKMNDELRLKKRLQIVGKYTDSYFGGFSFSKTNFKVSVSKGGGYRNDIKFAEFNDNFPRESYLRYSIKDTVMLKDKFFKIDTLLYNPTELVLKPLEIEKQVFGFKEGFKLNNYVVEDLNGNKVTLKKLANKKLLLLDFWGTWCQPCMELTPDLIELNNKYKSKLKLVSLAYQKEIKPVQEYVLKNKLDWFNGIIVKGNPKTFYEKRKIIRELKVRAFPTFILLDKDFNIVFRISGGGENFQKLLDVIDKY